MRLNILADPTLKVPLTSGEEAPSLETILLQHYLQMRSFFGSDLEAEIGVEPSLPQTGSNVVEHLLPATLGALNITGDLAPYGWRIGTGLSGAWQNSKDLWKLRFEAARLAFHEYAGALNLPLMGPVTLSSSVFTGNGEKVLQDLGLVKELPFLLAEAVLEKVTGLEEFVPGSVPGLLLDERSAMRALSGKVRTASGYRFYKPLGRSQVTEIWGTFLAQSSTAVAPEQTRFLLDSKVEVLKAALDAGTKAVFINPEMGDFKVVSAAWELLAEAKENGCKIGFLVGPGKDSRHSLQRVKMQVSNTWRMLGYRADDFSGFELMLSHRPGFERSALPANSELVKSAELYGFLKEAPSFA